MANFLKIELLHGGIARDQRQKDTLRGLGLRRRHQIRILKDTPAIRGMITKVYDLVKFEKTSNSKIEARAKIETYRLGPVPTQPATTKKVKEPKQVKASKPASAKAEGAKPKSGAAIKKSK